MKKLALLFFVGMLVLSCSEESEDLYDNELSNTIWTCSYIEPVGNLSEGHDFRDYYEPYLSLLESEDLPETMVYDTIYRTSNYFDYILKFNNQDCNLELNQQEKGQYRVKSYKVHPVYYPNQVFTDTRHFEDYSISIRVEVRDDTIFVDSSYYGEVSPDSIGPGFHLDGANIFYKTIEEQGVSPYSDYEGEIVTSACNMKFTRVGNNVSFNGDKNMTGLINETFDEMEIEEIGTFYKQ